jgi:putative membrane protein
MANERTFLAWIRTAIGIMAFGFVVEKFSLFVRQFAFILEKSGYQGKQISHPSGYSSTLGVLLVGLGALIGVLSFVRYKKVEKQIDEDSYQPSLLLNILLTLSVLATGIFLVIYLVHSV